MNTVQLALALQSAFALLLLWVFIVVFWKDYCLDVFRQHLFTLRDEMFDWAGQRNISFKDPAYRMLRYRMNQTIRYAHEFTLTRLVLSIIIVSRLQGDHAWDASLSVLTEPQRRALTEYRNRFAFYTLKYVVLRSFVLALLVLAIKLASGFREFVKRRVVASEVMVTAVDCLEIQSIEEGRKHERHHELVGV